MTARTEGPLWPSVAVYSPARRGGMFKYTRNLLAHVSTPCVWVTASRDVSAAQHRVEATWAPEVPSSGIVAKVALVARYALSLLRLGWICRKWRTPILHLQVFEPFSLRACWWWLRLSTTYIVLSAHDPLPQNYEARAMGQLMLTHTFALYRRADRVFVFSRRGAEILIHQAGVPAHKVVQLPLGLNEPLPQPPVSRSRPGRARFLFFGGYRQNKGLHVLVEAFLQAHSMGLQATLAIAGRYPEPVAQWVRERFEQQGCSRFLEFDNRFIPEDELDRIFRRADVLVLPYTQFSSQSGVIQMAYAYRLPVVVSDTGGLSELVLEHNTGLVVPPGDVSALAKAIRAVVCHYPEFLRTDTVRVLETDLSWHRIGDSTDAVYAQLLTGGTLQRRHVRLGG